MMDADGNVVDLFHGLDDLKNKIIRAVGNPHERYHEDALRMMRSIRFMSQLDFNLESELKRQLKIMLICWRKSRLNEFTLNGSRRCLGNGRNLEFKNLFQRDCISIAQTLPTLGMG